MYPSPNQDSDGIKRYFIPLVCWSFVFSPLSLVLSESSKIEFQGIFELFELFLE
jgi:hypothetical protein